MHRRGSAARRWAPHLAVGVVAFGFVLAPGEGAAVLQAAARWFLRRFDWLTLWGATACLLLCALMLLPPWGGRRIGGADARPEFRTLTWLSMLFAAGMGAGLVFWGAAEPLIHAGSPPPGSVIGGNPTAQAHALTQFHWSLHAWAIYAVAALAVALATKAGEAPLPSAPFEAAPRRARRLLDWTALVAVLFGLVASLGQGLFQMSAGAGFILGTPPGRATQLVLLLVLLAAYGTSAASGLRRGIAVLSLVNVALALLLLVFVLATGPTATLLETVGKAGRAYVEALPELSVRLRPEGAGRAWTREWSLTYFLWWVAWTPFVGVFVARISRGRTVRAFVTGVVLVPALATLLWFGVFGGAALEVQASGAELGVADFSTAPRATYALLGHYPLAALTQAVTLLLVFLFLVTSADSGAYVLGLLSRGGGEPPIAERLYWGVVLAAMTGAAIWSAGGQAVTRAMAVTGAIPLVFLLGAQAVTIVRRKEKGTPKRPF
ncbi:BCCT family transporter [Parvularcula dongshanensis]|uniref:Choline-glycine betaine transporter n=1 Tax=Parvularcula dongshanensis TaxID=1173995 RepID=A0A840I345_9PROT|nr:choline-glycine betaine transporter [Parvularcula dongshanensis]